MALEGGGGGAFARDDGGGVDSGGAEGGGVGGGRADRVWAVAEGAVGTATGTAGGSWAPPPEAFRTTLNAAGEKVTG